MFKLQNDELVKLKMILLAMNFNETFDCEVSKIQIVAEDEDNEYTFNLKMKNDVEEEE